MFGFAWKRVGVSAKEAMQVGATVRTCSRLPHILIPGAVITLTYAESDDYVGDKHKGVQHGEGTMLYKDGSTYTGNWEHGKKNGDGTLVTPYGRVHERFTGTTTTCPYYPDGSEYIGSMQNCQPYSRGRITCKMGPYSWYSVTSKTAREAVRAEHRTAVEAYSRTARATASCNS